MIIGRELKRRLMATVFSRVRLNTRRLKKDPVLLDAVMECTSFFPPQVRLSARIMAVLNEQEHPIRCLTCGQILWPEKHKGKQNIYCSAACTANSDYVKNSRERTNLQLYGQKNTFQVEKFKDKSRQTNLARYGVDYASQSDEIKKKMAETNMDRYGVINTYQADTIKEKIRHTMKQRYGVEYALQYMPSVMKRRYKFSQRRDEKEIIKYGELGLDKIEKIKKTNLERYGVPWVFQSPKVQEKIKKTNLERYGVSNPGASLEVQEKIKKTNLERYGVEWTLQSEVVRESGRQTSLDRYGVSNPGASLEVQEKIKKTNLERYGKPYHNSLASDVYEILQDPDIVETLLDTRTVEELSLLLGIHHTTLCRLIPSGILQGHRSAAEMYLGRWLADYTSIIPNSREIIPPYELDIYLPEYNMAIEYDGVYWHLEGNDKDKKYHLNKTLLCARKDIQLLHIFSSDNQDIWRCFIENSLGLSQTIYARQTIVKSIDNGILIEFCENNHLQGGINSKYNYGLFYDGVLVSVMTFSKARFSKADYELLRFCTLRGYRVVGGAGKLLKFFRRQHQGSIISYANLRWSNGKLYDALGFKFMHRSTPNYFYTRDCMTLYSRNKFQKHKLSKLLDYFDPDLTEVENMRLNGWDRIWDCGNLIYLLEK